MGFGIIRAIGVAGLAALLAVPAEAGRGSDADQIEEAYRTVYQIDIEDAEGRHRSIDKILVLDGQGVLVAKGWKGFRRTNQNRLDYSAVPYAGRFSQQRYDKEDFAPTFRVGEVRIDGAVMAFVLDEGAEAPRDEVAALAVLNQGFAFETRVAIKPGDWDRAGEGPEVWRNRGRLIGEVYWTGAGALMALVRPFVVTDSALW